MRDTYIPLSSPLPPAPRQLHQQGSCCILWLGETPKQIKRQVQICTCISPGTASDIHYTTYLGGTCLRRKKAGKLVKGDKIWHAISLLSPTHPGSSRMECTIPHLHYPQSAPWTGFPALEQVAGSAAGWHCRLWWWLPNGHRQHIVHTTLCVSLVITVELCSFVVISPISLG